MGCSLLFLCSPCTYPQAAIRKLDGAARDSFLCLENLLVCQHLARLLHPGAVGIRIFNMFLNNLRELVAYRPVVNVF